MHCHPYRCLSKRKEASWRRDCRVQGAHRNIARGSPDAYDCVQWRATMKRGREQRWLMVAARVRERDLEGRCGSEVLIGLPVLAQHLISGRRRTCGKAERVGGAC